MIKYITPHAKVSTGNRIAEVNSQIKHDFGALVDPFVLHTPSPPLLAGFWMALRESVLVGLVNRETKEAVATTVSLINRCPYCVDAHTIMMHAAAKHDEAKTISTGDEDKIKSEALRGVVKWAAATRSPDDPILQSPPYSPAEAPEIIGTAVVFHYINRMADIFLDESPLPIGSQRMKGFMLRMSGWYFSRAMRRTKQARESLAFLPPAELPSDLAWAENSPTVAAAFARWTAVIETSGQDVLSSATRDLVYRRISDWRGEDAGLRRNWVEDATAKLNEREKPAGRLTLLTALAPYQVDESVIASFRAQHPGDDELIAATAWAAHTAARRVGTWLHIGLDRR